MLEETKVFYSGLTFVLIVSSFCTGKEMKMVYIFVIRICLQGRKEQKKIFLCIYISPVCMEG